MSTKTAVITGGAGFVGSNLAERLLADGGTRVRIFDNMSRRGVQRNLEWLRSQASEGQLEIIHGDVRDFEAVKSAIRDADEIYHLAAQVAVTTSVEDPATDLQVNVLGTFHVLEAARHSSKRPFLLYTSTNKVYGSMESLAVVREGTRYVASRPQFRGASEEEPLDFHSPYGCSKGSADQYVRDYARVYGMDTVVFRMSCIAGPRQFGNEDQGWVAHFLYSTLEGKQITLCGDGLQVRDVLHVHDLVDAMMAAREHRARVRGEVFNLGGGLERAVSVKEMLLMCEQRAARSANLESAPMRTGDQPLYVADTSKLQAFTGWEPRRGLQETLDDIQNFWETELRKVYSRPHVSSEAPVFAGDIA